jgi:hypothetical protein
MVKSGVLPERRSYLRSYLEETRDGLIRDLGPLEADLTVAQRVLVDRVLSKLCILRVTEEWLKEHGLFTTGGELQPVLATAYLAYCNSLRLDLVALGLDKRKAGEILAPFEIVERSERAVAGRSSAGPDDGQGSDGLGDGDSGPDDEKEASGLRSEGRSPGG